MNDFYSLIDYLTDLLGVKTTIEKTSETWYSEWNRHTKRRINNKEVAKFILKESSNGRPEEILSVANLNGYASLQTVFIIMSMMKRKHQRLHLKFIING